MAFLKTLSVTQFRSYTSARLDALGTGFVILTGPNGAGKTNILEAVSLLSPGRGMRGAEMADWQNHMNAADPWAISALAETDFGPVQLGTGRDPIKEKRIVRIKGEPAKSQAALAEYVSCIWLTPQMDRLFIDGSSGRRRFFDRMVFSFDPAHAGRITRYENALSQRSKLLQEGKADPAWITALEQQMAETGMAVAAARVDFTDKLQVYCDRHGNQYLPAAKLSLKGFLEEALQSHAALKSEDLFKEALRTSRGYDAEHGGARQGPHKTDLNVVYRDKNMQADQCSTGEQKALLFGLILAHAHMMKAEKGAAPILLLDEVAAHLDADRRTNLFASLHELKAQVWITGTDKNVFETVPEPRYFFSVSEGQIAAV